MSAPTHPRTFIYGIRLLSTPHNCFPQDLSRDLAAALASIPISVSRAQPPRPIEQSAPKASPPAFVVRARLRTRTSRLRLHCCIPFEPASRAYLQGSAPVSSALLRHQPAPAQRTPPAITVSDAAARPVILGSVEKAPEDGIVKAEKYGGVRWSFAGMQVILLPRALALI